MAHAVGRVAAPAIRNAPLWLEQHLRTPWSSPALVPHLRGEQGALLVEEIIDAFETADKLGAPVKIRTLLALLACRPKARPTTLASSRGCSISRRAQARAQAP